MKQHPNYEVWLWNSDNRNKVVVHVLTYKDNKYVWTQIYHKWWNIRLCEIWLIILHIFHTNPFTSMPNSIKQRLKKLDQIIATNKSE